MLLIKQLIINAFARNYVRVTPSTITTLPEKIMSFGNCIWKKTLFKVPQSQRQNVQFLRQWIALKTVQSSCSVVISGKYQRKPYTMITGASRKTSVSRALVFISKVWIFDLRASGRGRKSSITEKTLTLILNSHDVEGRLAVSALSERCDMSIGAVYKVLTKQLNMARVHNGDFF